MTDEFKEIEGAMKGARDALSSIPEGRRGNHDTEINRAIKRLKDALRILSEHKRSKTQQTRRSHE